MKLSVVISIFVWVLHPRPSLSALVRDVAQIGPHHRIIGVEKNENPQNMMIVYTKLDENCRFRNGSQSGSRPVLDFYWLMDRERFKPVHSMIKGGVKKRLAIESADEGRRSFSIAVNDLRELRHDLEDPRLKVIARREGSSCEVDAYMKLGPSDGNALVRLETIYSESKKTFLPPFRKVTAITLIGTNTRTGQPVRRTYGGR